MTRYKGRIPDHLGTAFIVVVSGSACSILFVYTDVRYQYCRSSASVFERKLDDLYSADILLVTGKYCILRYVVRRYMIDESNKDYVKLAVAKGVNSKELMRKQIFRNAFVPLVQYIPTSFVLTVVGSIYVESLYSIPGMGGLLVKCIQTQDNTLVQALVLIYSALSIVGLILGDIMMTFVDLENLICKEGRRVNEQIFAERPFVQKSGSLYFPDYRRYGKKLENAVGLEGADAVSGGQTVKRKDSIDRQNMTEEELFTFCRIRRQRF